MKAIALSLLVLLRLAPLWSAPVEVVPPELHGAAQPQVAVSPSGRIHVAFGKENAIYYTGSDDGRTFSAPVKVGELDKLALRMRRGPRIAATEKIIAVTAISHADGNLHAWTSLNRGKSWREGTQVNDAGRSAREGMHAMAGDGKGFVFAAWLDARNGATELWGAGSQDGGVSWGANALVYRSPDGHVCECCNPSVAVDVRGRIVVMWRNWLGGSRDLYLSTSADRGTTFTPAEKLGSGTWKLDGCPMDGGAVALTDGGKPVAVWRREKAVFASEASSTERLLAAFSMQPVVTSSKNGLVFLWEHDGGLMIQRGPGSPERFADKAAAPSIAALPARGEIVVWESTAGGTATILAESLP